MKMRTAIVVGATGLTGTSLVEQLCESDEYASVIVIARRNLTFQHPKLEVKIRSFDIIEEKDIDFADDLFCCLGTTIKKAGSREEFEKVDFEYPLRMASLAKKRGISHMLVMSAMGVKETSPFYYNRVKGKLEHDLIEIGLPRLSIIRPSLLVGKRKEFRLGEKVGELVLKVAKPFLVGPLKRFQSIEASQVAKAMIVIALQRNKEAVAIYSSHELAKMDFLMIDNNSENSREAVFNWDKRKYSMDESKANEEKVDRDIIFTRNQDNQKNDVVDREVHFNRQKNRD